MSSIQEDFKLQYGEISIWMIEYSLTARPSRVFSLSLQNVNMKFKMRISPSAIYEWNCELILHIKV